MKKAVGAIILILTMIASGIGFAVDVVKVKTFGSWDVLVAQDNAQKITGCYAFAVPKSSYTYNMTAGPGTLKEPAYVIISQVMRRAWTFSTRISNKIQKDDAIFVEIAGRSRLLSPYHEIFGMTSSSRSDVALINALIKNDEEFHVRLHSIDQNAYIDTYSLNGMRETLNYMEQNCSPRM